MHYFKGLYLGRILNSGFVIASGSASFIIDPTVWVFEGEWNYREDLLEKIIEYLEKMPRPLHVFVTHEHKDHADIKVLEILQRHFSARIYVPAGIKNVILKASLFLTSLHPVNIGDTIKAGSLKIKALKGGDTANALSYLVEAWKKTIYFAGDQFSEWQEITVDYIVLPLWFIIEMHDNFEKALEKVKCKKIILSHFNSKYQETAIKKVKKELGEKIIVLNEFSNLIML